MPRISVSCTYCGATNSVPFTPSMLDHEGNNYVSRLKKQNRRTPIKFNCTTCKKHVVMYI